MQAIHALAERYGFRIIEDASHAIGGTVSQAEPIGNGRYSDITVFSFHPVKIITTGEGGMALTNDAELAERMALLRSHGITRDPAQMTREADGPWYYQQIELGFNYRMTDLQAALGVSQMARLDEYVARRHALAARYDELLADLPVTTPWQHPDGYSACTCTSSACSRTDRESHREVFEALRERGHRRERALHPGAHPALLSAHGLQGRRFPRGRALLRRGDQPADVPDDERRRSRIRSSRRFARRCRHEDSPSSPPAAAASASRARTSSRSAASR